MFASIFASKSASAPLKLLFLALCLSHAAAASAQTPEADGDPKIATPELSEEADGALEADPAPEAAGTMTVERLGDIIARLDPDAQNNGAAWRFKIEDVTVLMMTDFRHNRMRLMAAIKPSADLSPEELLRIAQANFDTALDARYAVAQNILWATFIHPLRELFDRQFITAIGQTVNAAKSYGTTYSSGLLTYGGGDSNAILQRELIDKLLRKGEEI